ERDAAVTASVPDGLDVRGEAREWEGEHPAAWGSPLAAIPGPNGKPGRAVTAVTGKADGGLARVTLAWHPHRPDLTADVRADVTLSDRQVEVRQTIRLRSPDGLPRPVRFRGPASASGLGARPPLEPLGPGEWNLTPPPDAKELTLTVVFAVPLPPRSADDHEAWRVPVGLLWPAGSTRADATVRVWA